MTEEEQAYHDLGKRVANSDHALIFRVKKGNLRTYEVQLNNFDDYDVEKSLQLAQGMIKDHRTEEQIAKEINDILKD